MWAISARSEERPHRLHAYKDVLLLSGTNVALKFRQAPSFNRHIRCLSVVMRISYELVRLTKVAFGQRCAWAVQTAEWLHRSAARRDETGSFGSNHTFPGAGLVPAGLVPALMSAGALSSARDTVGPEAS